MPKFALSLSALGLLAGCNHVEATHNRCGGVVACAKGPCDPIDVLSDRPSRPFRELGVVEVRVDRGTALRNVTLADAMPALVAEGRAMGADAIILTHEEFTSWYDKGEPASPIHDLERQESWYITEKARYVSGLAVAYTSATAAPPPASAGPTYAPGVVRAPQFPYPPGTSAPIYRGPLQRNGAIPVARAPAPVAPPPPPPPPAPAPAPVPPPPPPPTPAPPPAPEPMENPDPPQVPGVPDLPPVPRPQDVPPVPPAPEVPPIPDVPPVPKPPPDLPR